MSFFEEGVEILDPTNDTGYENEAIELFDEQLLKNIHTLQSQNNIKSSPALVKDLGRCSLDIEMETGTGKTYAYIKTMFELNKKYGWSKFIVVVPSVASATHKEQHNLIYVLDALEAFNKRFVKKIEVKGFDKAFRAEKAIQDYVFTDGSAKKSVERRFAEDMDVATEVCGLSYSYSGWRLLA